MSSYDYFMKRTLTPFLKRSVRASLRILHCIDDMRPEYLRDSLMSLFPSNNGKEAST